MKTFNLEYFTVFLITAVLMFGGGYFIGYKDASIDAEKDGCFVLSSRDCPYSEWVKPLSITK